MKGLWMVGLLLVRLLLAGGFLWAFACRARSAAALRAGAGNCCGKRRDAVSIARPSFPPPSSLTKLPGTEHRAVSPETGMLGCVKDDAVRDQAAFLA